MQICGEHKESGILKHGFFASPFSQEAGLIHTDSEVVERGKGGYLLLQFYMLSFIDMDMTGFCIKILRFFFPSLRPNIKFVNVGLLEGHRIQICFHIGNYSGYRDKVSRLVFLELLILHLVGGKWFLLTFWELNLIMITFIVQIKMNNVSVLYCRCSSCNFHHS